jgi:TP901 family phage tail tape measure protein
MKVGLALGAWDLASKAVEMIKAGAAFQQQMLMIQTQAGASATEVRNMSAAVLSMAGQVATTPEELAVALYHVESVGLRAGAALDVLRIAAEGAKIGNADLEETTNALTATVASGIPGVQNMGQAMGALNAVVGAGDMKLQDLNEALGSGLLTVVKGYGLTLTDVGAALATFGDNNIRGANAATMLRVSVQALAVPAKGGAAELAKLGMTSTQMAKDMQSGGLNAALVDLKTHLDAAGVSSDQVGAIITTVFGKRAGPGVAVLIGQMDRFQTKLEDVKAGANGFGAAWDATQKTTSYAFQKIGAEAQAAGIAIFNSVGPGAAAVADWLGSTLPAAFKKVQDVVGPLEQEVGGALVLAWHAFAAVLSVVGSALSTVGDFLDHHKVLVQGVGTAVLAMWATYKGYQIVTAAVKAVGDVLAALRLKALNAVTSMQNVTTEASLMQIGAAQALGVIGIALGVATWAWASHQQEVAKNKAEIDNFTEAIKQDNGALGENTRALVENSLQKDGAFDAARKLGLSLSEVTDAALKGGPALTTLRAEVDALGDSTVAAYKAGKISGDEADRQYKLQYLLKDALSGTNTQLDAAKQAADNYAAANATAANATATLDSAVYSTTQTIDKQSTAVDALKTALDDLSNNAATAQEAELKLKDGIGQATTQVQQYGTSLDENTDSGRKNQEWLLAQIKSVNDSAEAQFKAGDTLDQVTGKMGVNEDALRRAAYAAGFNKDQVDAMIQKYAAVPSDVNTDVQLQTSQAFANAEAIKAELASIQKSIDVNVNVTINRFDKGNILNGIGANAAGTDNWRGGWTWVGEQGPELVNLPAGSKVLDNNKSTRMTQQSSTQPAGPTQDLTGLHADLAQLTDTVAALGDRFDQALQRQTRTQQTIARAR